MTPTKRKYDISDPNMIQHGKTMHSHFLDQQADFTAFDPDLDIPFESAWEGLIETAADQPTDESMVDQLEDLTALVDTALNNCLRKFRESRHFIEKAFPDRPARHKEFGYDDLKNVRRSQTGMIQFMRTFFATATKYAIDLAAANYDAAAVAEISTLRTALEDADTAQEKFKGTREDTTEQRVLAMNAAWDMMLVVSKAGKAIFFDDAGKYHWFLLPASSIPAAELSITGKVTAQAAGNPIEGASVTLMELAITVPTDSTGQYAFAIIPDGTYTLQIDAVGFMSQTINGVTVQDDGKPTVADVALMAGP